jgi:hypothetical protein
MFGPPLCHLDQWQIFYWPKIFFSGQPKAGPHFRYWWLVQSCSTVVNHALLNSGGTRLHQSRPSKLVKHDSTNHAPLNSGGTWLHQLCPSGQPKAGPHFRYWWLVQSCSTVVKRGKIGVIMFHHCLEGRDWCNHVPPLLRGAWLVNGGPNILWHLFYEKKRHQISIYKEFSD